MDQLLPTALNILDRYGFPIFILVIGAIALWRGALRVGTDVDSLLQAKASELATLQKQVDYTEQRRLEERQARIEAEERLESNNVALREATGAFRDANELMQRLLEQRPSEQSRRPARPRS